MDFYQACYGKPDGINWTIFNNTIPNMYDSHKNLFVKASSYCSPDMIRNSLGGRLPEDLYELVILKDATCLFLAKYWNAGADSPGAKETRDVMFAHGFVFNTKDIVQTPDYLLRIRDDNFKFTVEETSSQPPYLECDPPFSVDGAMNTVSLTKEKWNTLMECIYTQRDSRSNDPLFIKVSSREEMKALIYCILYALPKQLRHSFAFSNENSINGTMFGKDIRGELIQPQRIFFTQNIPERAIYYDPQSGATNADLRYIREGIAEYPAYNFFRDGSTKEYAAYCEVLDETFTELGLPELASLSEVELANFFVERDTELKNKNELESWKYLINLIKKLRENNIQNAYTDEYIADVLEMFDKRGFIPNEAVMQYIKVWSANTTIPRLTEIYNKLQMRFLMSNGNEAIEDFLNKEYTNSGKDFHSWCERIIGIDGGLECVTDFYIKLITSAKDYDAVAAIYEDGLIHLPQNEWKNKALECDCRLAYKIFKSEYLNTSHFDEEFALFKDALSRTFKEGDVNYLTMRPFIIDNFWKSFEPKYFCFKKDCIANCREMLGKKQPEIECLIKIYENVGQAKANELSPQAVFDCITQFKKVMDDDPYDQRLFDTEEKKKNICTKIQEFTAKGLCSLCGDRMFKEWIGLASLSKQNPIVILYRLEIPIVCDPEIFDSQLEKDEEMQKMVPEIIFWIEGEGSHAGAIQRLGEDREAVSILKHEAKTAADYEKQKAALAKKQEREIRKQEKQLDSSELKDDSKGASGGKKSLFGGIFGGKK